MVNNRIKHENDFYIPNPEYHLNSLIYHAIIHKPKISNTYIKVFKQYGSTNENINKKNLKVMYENFYQ